MAADLPPYMNAYGNIERILTNIKAAATPPEFTQDYLTGEPGFGGGSALSFISYAKRIGLIRSDGGVRSEEQPTTLNCTFTGCVKLGA